MTGSYRASIGHNPLIRVKKQSVGIVGWDIGGVIAAVPGGGTLDFNDGFEAANLDLNLYNTSVNGAGVLATSPTHAREGGRSLHTKVTKNGTTNFRQEVRIKCPAITDLVMTGSEDFWMGFSVYIPEASSLAATRILSQFNTTDFGSGFAPVIALRCRNNNFEISGAYHNGADIVVFGAATKNVWYDFVWRIRWRSQTATGINQFWWNNALVLNENNVLNANPTEPGDKIHFAKIGNYAGTWDNAGDGTANGTIVEAYHDSIRQAMGANLFDLVKPVGNRLTAP